jgi:hypothetical protein
MLLTMQLDSCYWMCHMIQLLLLLLSCWYQFLLQASDFQVLVLADSGTQEGLQLKVQPQQELDSETKAIRF